MSTVVLFPDISGVGELVRSFGVCSEPRPLRVPSIRGSYLGRAGQSLVRTVSCQSVGGVYDILQVWGPEVLMPSTIRKGSRTATFTLSHSLTRISNHAITARQQRSKLGANGIGSSTYF